MKMVVSAQRWPQGHPQRGRRRLPGRMRAPRLAAHRAALGRRRRAPHRLSRLLPQQVFARDDAAAVHAPERRRGAAGVAGLRGLQPRAAAQTHRGQRPARRACW